MAWVHTWLFETEDFQAWLKERNPYANLDPAEVGDDLGCAACGSERSFGMRFFGPVCGFCVAYEYGVDSQERRLASLLGGLLRALAEDAPDRNQRLLRQLLMDLEASLAATSE